MFAVGGGFPDPVGNCAISHGTQFEMCPLQFLLPIVFFYISPPIENPNGIMTLVGIQEINL